MGKKNELFLVVDADGCWCKTIFNIDTNPGVPRVKEVEELGCCQSLFVPQPGDSLDGSQDIIPSNYASAYAAGGNPEEGVIWHIKPACSAEGVSCGYKFLTPELGSPLTNCTRQIVSGKFTWPMKASYMDKMIEKLKYILACANSGGAADEKLKTDDPEEPYIAEGCEVTICDLVRDRVERGLMDYNTPGCVSEGCDEESSSEPNPYPWNEVTCGGIECESKGPRYYCRTIEDLEAILDAAEEGLRPYEPPADICRPCTCSWTTECESVGGEAASCWVYVGVNGEALIGWEYVTECETGSNVDRYDYDEGILQLCGDDLVNSGVCGFERTLTQTCEGAITNSFDLPIFGSNTPDWSGLQSYAYASHSNGCPSHGCGAASSLGYQSVSVGGVVGNGPAAWAEMRSGRVRFRMAGSYSCNGEQTPTRTVRYNKIIASHNGSTSTQLTATATWDSGEMTYVTPWIEQPALEWPENPSGLVYGTFNSITYEFVSGDRLCPEGCNPV
jgi:hypothetical protein